MSCIDLYFLQSKELKDRLERLQEMADRKEYDALVRDVSLKKEDRQYFSSFKDQLGYGNIRLKLLFSFSSNLVVLCFKEEKLIILYANPLSLLKFLKGHT
jgi:hypothetical protein